VKKKGWIYGIGAVTRTKHVDKLTYYGNSSHSSKEIVHLKQKSLNYRKDNERLSQQLQQRQFQFFVSVVLPFLPPDVQTILQQHQEQQHQLEQSQPQQDLEQPQ